MANITTFVPLREPLGSSYDAHLYEQKEHDQHQFSGCNLCFSYLARLLGATQQQLFSVLLLRQNSEDRHHTFDEGYTSSAEHHSAAAIVCPLIISKYARSTSFCSLWSWLARLLSTARQQLLCVLLRSQKPENWPHLFVYLRTIRQQLRCHYYGCLVDFSLWCLRRHMSVIHRLAPRLYTPHDHLVYLIIAFMFYSCVCI